jgi:hypothetical protein
MRSSGKYVYCTGVQYLELCRHGVATDDMGANVHRHVSVHTAGRQNAHTALEGLIQCL